MEKTEKIGKTEKKSVLLPIRASHVEIVTDKRREKEIEEIVKRLKKLE